MTRPEFARIVEILSAALDREMPNAQVEIWFRLLQRFPVEAVQKATLRHLSESKSPFLPPPGVIVGYATEAIYGTAETSDSAFEKMCAMRRRYGADIATNREDGSQEFRARPHLGDKLWQVVQGLGGWARICNSEQDITTERAQFRGAWDRLTEREDRSLVLPESLQPRVRQDGGATVPLKATLPARNAVAALASQFDVSEPGGEIKALQNAGVRDRHGA